METKELEWLSRHLAHNMRTQGILQAARCHMVEIAKVGRVMMAADEGDIGQYSNMGDADSSD